MFEEGEGEHQIYRLEIPPSPHRPHCTASGTYKVRADSQTVGLVREQLLRLFLEVEAGEFLRRFREANEGLASTIAQMSVAIERRLKAVQGSAEEAECYADEAAGTSERILEQVEDINRKVDELLSGR